MLDGLACHFGLFRWRWANCISVLWELPGYKSLWYPYGVLLCATGCLSCCMPVITSHHITSLARHGVADHDLLSR